MIRFVWTLALLLIPVSSSAVTVHNMPGQNHVTASVKFTATIVANSELAITEHDLGGGLYAYVGKYDEFNTENGRHETTEMLAMAGDGVDFNTSGRVMVARRYRHDTWPSPIRVACK